MRYIRKFTALILAIIFCAAIAIGIGVIFSIKNVNVECIDYSGVYTERFAETKENLNKLKGSGLLFLKDSDVKDKISDSDVIAVKEYERVFPCTVSVVLKERVECFVVKGDGVYCIYDEDGELMKRKSFEEGQLTYLNGLDGSPDVILDVPENQIKSVAAVCSYFKQYFGSLRKLVASVSLTNMLDVNILSINLRCGLTLAVGEWTVNAKEKMERAYETYSRLPDSKKVKGMITVIDGGETTGPVAIYR